MRRNDPDYHDNQVRAQQAWRKSHPDYWREYRHTHPEYVERNRAQQKKRNGRSRDSRIANMDASSPDSPLPSGFYWLSPAGADGIAKMDVWTVKITLISDQRALPLSIAKRGLDRQRKA